ncbi:MAG: protein tyrosine phosphatase family protein [Actinomycetota bacterium]|nr:protein tyrosine phosphatase family protein [Actinomycetota bacterium]
MQDIRELAPDLVNAEQPLPDVATAGQPEGEHFKRLAEAGYRTVIDLRTSGEDRGLDEPEAIRRAGMEYVSIPVGHEDIDDGTFDKFRELMADQVRRPVLVHCSSANRVGALLVPYLVLDEGKSAEEASLTASRVGLRSENLRRAALRYAAIRPERR